MRFLILAVLLAGSACVYRQDIPQGNFFKRDDLNRLEIGMTRDQVKFIMGEPMITDPFHPDRWDYVMYIDSQEEARDLYRRVTVFFDANTLARIETAGMDEELDTSENIGAEDLETE